MNGAKFPSLVLAYRLLNRKRPDLRFWVRSVPTNGQADFGYTMAEREAVGLDPEQRRRFSRHVRLAGDVPHFCEATSNPTVSIEPGAGATLRTVRVDEMQPGDYAVAAAATVTAVDRFLGMVIVDFDDCTATAPVPGNFPAEVLRAPQS